jgi:replicative DNA helicase Mcm
VNPGAVLEDVEAAIINDQLIKTKDGKELPKGGINIRFTNLPRKTGIRNIRSDDINTFVSVEGILRKTTEVRPRIVQYPGNRSGANACAGILLRSLPVLSCTGS